MMCKITIRMDNAAFRDQEDGQSAHEHELARILRWTADQVAIGHTDLTLMDWNGNRVGQLVIEED